MSMVKQITLEFRAKSDLLMKQSKGVKAIQDLLDLFSISKAENVRANWPVNVAMDENETMGLEVFDYLQKEGS